MTGSEIYERYFDIEHAHPMISDVAGESIATSPTIPTVRRPRISAFTST